MEHLMRVDWLLFSFGLIVLAICAWLKSILDSPRQEVAVEGAKPAGPAADPRLSWTPQMRYDAWRKDLAEWADSDSGQEGLAALLERWRGVPHEKPKPVVGVDVAANVPSVTVFDVVTNENGVAKHHRIEFKSPEPITGEAIKKAVSAILADAGLLQRAEKPPLIMEFLKGNQYRIRALLNTPINKLAEAEKPDAYPWMLDGKKLMIGSWVRWKNSGELCRVVEASGKHLRLQFRRFALDVSQLGNVVPAIPRPGEWWRKIKTCSTVRDQLPLEPHQIIASGPCPSCIYEPAGFGYGEEAKA